MALQHPLQRSAKTLQQMSQQTLKPNPEPIDFRQVQPTLAAAARSSWQASRYHGAYGARCVNWLQRVPRVLGFQACLWPGCNPPQTSSHKIAAAPTTMLHVLKPRPHREREQRTCSTKSGRASPARYAPPPAAQESAWRRTLARRRLWQGQVRWLAPTRTGRVLNCPRMAMLPLAMQILAQRYASAKNPKIQ